MPCLEEMSETMKHASRWSHLPAVSGIFFIIVGVLPLGLLPPPPAAGEPVTEIVAYYHAYGSTFLHVTYLGILGSGFFLWFLGYLHTQLKQSSTATYGPTVALSAGICWNIIFLLFSGLILSLPRLASSPSTYSELAFLSNVTDIGFLTNSVPATVLVGTVSLIIWQSRLLPRWLSLLGLLVVLIQMLSSLGMIISSGPLVPAGLVYDLAFALLGFWVLCLSLMLLVQKPEVNKAISPSQCS
jgi:hypothetical protein